jgi:redox-sensitive bicupin YhaK (pirin superfamily)
MEIITYVLSGALEHKDSMGNGRVIRPGEVQYMAAGSGVTHSEFNPSKDEAVASAANLDSAGRTKAPSRATPKNRWRQAVGALHLMVSKAGRDGSIAIRQDADLWLAKLDSGTRRFAHAGEKRNAWVHVAEGEVI